VYLYEKGAFHNLGDDCRPETPSIIHKALKMSEQQDLLRGSDASASIIASSDAPSGSAYVPSSRDSHSIAASSAAAAHYAHSLAPSTTASTSTAGDPVAAWRRTLGPPASIRSNPFSLADSSSGASCAQSVLSSAGSSVAGEALLRAYTPSTASSAPARTRESAGGSAPSALDRWRRVFRLKARGASVRSTSTAGARVGASSSSEEYSRTSRGSRADSREGEGIGDHPAAAGGAS